MDALERSPARITAFYTYNAKIIGFADDFLPSKMIDKKELSSLSPEERLKRLKLMEEDRKKDVEEIGTLIKDSLKDIKNIKLADEVAPQARIVDISRLFESTGQGLEKISGKKDAPGILGRMVGYQIIGQANYDYSIFRKLDSLDEEKRKIGDSGERVNLTEKYMTSGEKVASMVDSSRMVLYKARKQSGFE